jgi:hypothetical protein
MAETAIRVIWQVRFPSMLPILDVFPAERIYPNLRRHLPRRANPNREMQVRSARRQGVT